MAFLILKSTYNFLKSDLISGLILFFVALPLCLGIALASGAPLFSGIVSGVVGGIVVGLLSQSHVSVSGPAAGLSAIVLSAISTLGSFELFLAAVVIAGIIQLLLALIRAGSISNYFPSNVIEGMLTGIGMIIIIKQIPLVLGYDSENVQFGFTNDTDANILLKIVRSVHPGVLMVSLFSGLLLIAFHKMSFVKNIKVLPAGLLVVLLGVGMNEYFIQTHSIYSIDNKHLVSLPVIAHPKEIFLQLSYPDFSGWMNAQVWTIALTIAIVASIESLLSLEAAGKMDPLKRYAGGNRELAAQGVGNILSGLLGGLPMTSVIVRASANIASGAKTKLSAIAHGLFLLVAVMLIPNLLNKIPLASLATILIMVGYRLASPSVFKRMWQNGKLQFIPFITTVIAVVLLDLLVGVAIGMIVSIVFILRGNMKRAYFLKKEGHKENAKIVMKLTQEVSFLNKAAIKQTLGRLPKGCQVIIDASDTIYIDHDVLELIQDFYEAGANERNIKVERIGFKM
jgi:MFS superfamily sulfate permease-like transporter